MDSSFDDGRCESEHLDIVVGTEHDAIARLMQFALAKAQTLAPARGYRITQDGTRLVVSSVEPGPGRTYHREYRFTAARIW
ncbi:MAG: hypothetical protein FWE61_11000 [Micrococcales bacterium]|nr:hypothetical protein [Micrococcales bacterium]